MKKLIILLSFIAIQLHAPYFIVKDLFGNRELVEASNLFNIKHRALANNEGMAFVVSRNPFTYHVAYKLKALTSEGSIELTSNSDLARCLEYGADLETYVIDDSGMTVQAKPIYLINKIFQNQPYEGDDPLVEGEDEWAQFNGGDRSQVTLTMSQVRDIEHLKDILIENRLLSSRDNIFIYSVSDIWGNDEVPLEDFDFNSIIGAPNELRCFMVENYNEVIEEPQ